MPQSLQEKQSILLPDQYQDPTRPIAPTSMSSTPLKFAPDGRVVWDQIWATFCDLAMAGGPPHRGTLLDPATLAQIAAAPGPYHQAAEEISRGITLVSTLEAAPASLPGWVRVVCPNPTMAGWLTRAITMENVSAHHQGPILYLPAGPTYRLEKEIKNVITALAKTNHYWRDHIPPTRKQAIATLFAESPLIQPALNHHPNWRPVDCHTIPAAITLMRAIATANILTHREQTLLYLPLNPQTDPGGTIVTTALLRLWPSSLANRTTPAPLT